LMAKTGSHGCVRSQIEREIPMKKYLYSVVSVLAMTVGLPTALLAQVDNTDTLFLSQPAISKSKNCFCLFR